MEQYLRRMWEHITVNRKWTKEVLADAEKEMQEGIQGTWQKESPHKEELELVKRSNDLSVNAYLLRRAYYAGRPGNWEFYKEECEKSGKISVWASIKVKECYEKVESEEKSRMSIAQDILRRIIAPVVGVCHLVVRVSS